MSAELIAALQTLTEKLNKIDGEIYRDKGANIDPAYSQILYLDNTTTKENPNLRINYDFKSLAITDGTDNDTYIYAILGRVNGSKKPIKFKNNSTYASDFQITEITIYSPAQAGKQVTINLFKDAIYTSGSLVNSGVVTTARPTAFTTSIATIPASTPTIVLPLNTARKSAMIKNPLTSTVYFGDASVSASYMDLAPGDKLVYDNSSALYFFSTIATQLIVFEET
jgi:hypothetical protein